MRDVVIVDAIRTPSGRGKPGGALSGAHPVDLLADVLAALVARSDLDPVLVDDVIAGCVTQAGEQTGNVGRHAVLAAGLPVSIPATTIDRQCGSSQQAVHFAAQAIAAGAADVVIACGVESMSRLPLGSSTLGRDVAGARVRERFGGLVHQGISAELIAARWGLTRDALDAYAAESHWRAAATDFSAELLPVAVPGPDGDGVVVSADETVRPGTTPESLAGLAPAFEDPRAAVRFPEIAWRITAGNASPLTDGASGALLMGADVAVRLGLAPRARVVATAVVGDDPILMLTAPIPATARVLQRAGLTIDDVDAVEVNEAFASVPLAWLAETGADPARLNPRGGAIALGHPLVASGTRLLTTLLAQLDATGGRYGLQTMCEGGGMANALVVERLA